MLTVDHVYGAITLLCCFISELITFMRIKNRYFMYLCLSKIRKFKVKYVFLNSVIENESMQATISLILTRLQCVHSIAYRLRVS